MALWALYQFTRYVAAIRPVKSGAEEHASGNAETTVVPGKTWVATANDSGQPCRRGIGALRVATRDK
jgi:hypothetical protein